MKRSESSEHFKKMFKVANTKVMTLKEMIEKSGSSLTTVRRRMKRAKVISSFNKNGMYYTLPEIPVFDENGLWAHKGIRFSRYGNLKKTLAALVDKAESGLSAEALSGIIGYGCHSLLCELAVKKLVHREKHGRSFIYFSITPAVFKHQRAQYKIHKEESIDIEYLSIPAVRLLIEKINHPNESAAGLAKILKAQGIEVTEAAIERFFIKVGFEKKTA